MCIKIITFSSLFLLCKLVWQEVLFVLLCKLPQFDILNLFYKFVLFLLFVEGYRILLRAA